MTAVANLVTQSGADTSTRVEIDTGLVADGKSGWEIFAMQAYWVDGLSVAAADYVVNAIVSTVDADTLFSSEDEIARVSWGLQNTGGVAVAVGYEPIKRVELIEPRITVQPTIYVGVQSQTSGIANDIVIILYYNIVKLTDLEVLRLLAGGA